MEKQQVQNDVTQMTTEISELRLDERSHDSAVKEAQAKQRKEQVRQRKQQQNQQRRQQKQQNQQRRQQKQQNHKGKEPEHEIEDQQDDQKLSNDDDDILLYETTINNLNYLLSKPSFSSRLPPSLASQLLTLTSSLPPLSIPSPSSLPPSLLSWLSSPSQFYDEMFESDGTLRDAWKDIYPVYLKLWGEESDRIQNFPTVSLKMFQGDNSLHHLPRMFTKKEFEHITAGVKQRAMAFRSFVNDHYFGEKRYASSNVLPSTVVSQLVSRSLEENLDQKMSQLAKNTGSIPNWGFWYGPDIIRGPEGKFYVVEDNIGYVGGLGDLYLAQSCIREKFPEYSPHLSSLCSKDSSDAFFEQLCEDYKRAAAPDIPVLIYYPGAITADNEEKRVIKIFKKFGIPSVKIPQTRARKGKGQRKGPKRLEVDRRGVWLIQGNRRTKVGLVVIDAEAYDVDPRNITVKKKSILDEAEGWLEFYQEELEERPKRRKGKKKQQFDNKHNQTKKKAETLQSLITATQQSDVHMRRLAIYLRKNHRASFRQVLNQGIPGLIKAYFAGSVALINGPGFDFMGDKLFCTYVDKLISFYLNEEPILSSIPTFSLGEGDTKSLTNAIFHNPAVQERVVLKKVDGRGGDSVWVGPKIPKSDFEEVEAKILAEPERFICQKYIPLSQVSGQLVDLRVLCGVTGGGEGDGVVVSGTFWGRGVPAEGSNGKVNISDRGFEFSIGVKEE